jgi:hypothetical protein
MPTRETAVSTSPTAPVRLELDRLVREYMENLNVTLRGFKAAEEFGFLEAWVPSDDPTESALDLVELARAGGVGPLTIVVEEATFAQLDLARLESAGPVEQRREPGHVVLAFGGPAAATLDAHPCHAVRLQVLLADVRHEGSLGALAGADLAEATLEGMTLQALVDRKRRLVTRAAFSGAASATQRALLEGLARALENKPIQEGADHAVLALEHSLRDPAVPPPVPGVVTPENAGPAFALMQKLARALLADYRARTGYSDTQNFFDRPVGAQWAAHSEAQRLNAVRAALEPHAGQVSVVGLDGPKRVVVRFVDSLDSQARQGLLVRLEDHLRKTVEPTLQLTAQTKADVNILRQPDKRNA